MGMTIDEVIKWLTIMKANLNSFPEVSNAKKIGALAEAIRFLKNEESEKPRWILDSERLPDEPGRYLITYCYGDTIETQEANYAEEYDGDKWEAKWYDTTDIEITLAVIAWMPLPKPYKAENEDN